MLEVAQDGEHAAVRLVGRRHVELAEDVGHVLLDGALGDHERRGDRAVRAALGHQRRAPRSRAGRARRAGPAAGAHQQLRDDLGVERGAAGGHAPERLEELAPRRPRDP